MAITHTEIMVAGKPRRLRFDVNSIADMMARLDRPLDEMPMLPAARLILWSGLRGEDRKLTLQDAGALIGEHIAAGGEFQALAMELFNAVTMTLTPPVREGDPGNVPSPTPQGEA